jgi:hypothetical protein
LTGQEFEHVTTEAVVEAYESSSGIFAGLLSEVRELSKKKPEATMSTGKVKIINRVLSDLINFLSSEPEGKYLEKLDDQALPQMSDAVLVMVQFEQALRAFHSRYHKRVYGGSYWITKELLDKWAEADEDEEEDEEVEGDKNY